MPGPGPQHTKDEHFNAVSDAISRVLIPVMLCMSLSVWFVNSLGDIDSCKPAERKLEDITLFPDVLTSSSSTSLYAGIFIGVFVVLVVVFTFFMVWLYKSGRRNVIQIWLMVSVFLILSYAGGVYLFDFCRSHCINIDWITLVVAVWNFAVTGLFAVFGRVPRFINQGYLIVISSLMAYTFRTLPGYAVWVILGLLVIWDLFAVLSPKGPLRMLVNAARERDDDLPALIYDTNPAAPGRELNSTLALASKIRKKPAHIQEHLPPDSSTATTNIAAPSTSSAPTAQISSASIARGESVDAAAPEAPEVKKSEGGLKRLFRRNVKKSEEGGGEASVGDGTGTGGGTASQTNEPHSLPVNADGQVQVGTLGTHLKLGLGDFVFYSILVAQASRAGPMTAIASFVAILAGLCATLFLVTVMRKALPALPISITAGLITHFLTQYTLLPYAENLLPRLLFH